jgi:hypothetical protein
MEMRGWNGLEGRPTTHHRNPKWIDLDMELDEKNSKEHERIHQVKQGWECSPISTNRRTSRPTRLDESSLHKVEKGGGSLVVERWERGTSGWWTMVVEREGLADGGSKVLYHV